VKTPLLRQTSGLVAADLATGVQPWLVGGALFAAGM